MCKKLICLTAVLFVLGPAMANAASQGPVGWWKFDETSGTTAADSVGGNNGTLIGDPAWTTGQIGGALQFDSTDDYVTLPIGSLISTLSDTTITLWANFANAGGDWQRMFDIGSGTSVYMFLTPKRGTSGSMRFAIRTAAVGEQILNATAPLPAGWHHVGVVMNSKTMTMQMYVDGTMVRSAATTLLPKDMGVTTQNWLGKSQYPADALYRGALDEFRIYDRALTGDEVVNAMGGGLGYGLANTPVVANKATDVLRDQKLSWTAGQEAQTHDVYFGTVRDDVANATVDNPLGVLVAKGQADTTLDPGRLEFGTTYYWRIDEVGAAPDFMLYKGNVWSFTVEPLAYTIAKTSITATASSSNSDTMGPGKTIDESGLTNDLHSTLETAMWLSSATGPEPAWIRYAFDKVYALNTMLVWNSNQALEPVVGYGAMSVTVEYSVDANNWTSLGDVEFVQAPGEPNYAANTTVDFGGVPAKFVKLTINSNWGGVFPEVGLSEVRFSRFPYTASYPSPAPAATNQSPQVPLTWRAGRQAASHEVYLGIDKQAVTDGTALAATVAAPSYDPALELDRTYYWKITEVNAVETITAWAGDVWSFSTQPYIRVYTFANTADRALNYGTERTLTAATMDWTLGGAATLAVSFTPIAGNPAGNLYLKINDTRVSYADASDLTRQVRQQWNVDLASLGVDLTNVPSIGIGVESDGAGVVTLNDLLLYRAAPVVQAPVDPGTNGLGALYAFEDNADDSSGNGQNGTLTGCTFVDGQAGFGKALDFDGTDDYATLPIGSLLGSLSDITVATWANFSNSGGAWQRIFDFGSGTGVYMFLCPRVNTAGSIRFAIRTAAVGEQVVNSPATLPSGWHHVAVSIDSATKTIRLYQDGTLVGSGATTLLPKDMGVTTQNWLGKSQWPDALYKGSLDDFRIFNRVLSEGELRYLAGDR